MVREIATGTKRRQVRKLMDPFRETSNTLMKTGSVCIGDLKER